MLFNYSKIVTENSVKICYNLRIKNNNRKIYCRRFYQSLLKVSKYLNPRMIKYFVNFIKNLAENEAELMLLDHI